jgi:hypothetical protein
MPSNNTQSQQYNNRPPYGQNQNSNNHQDGGGAPQQHGNFHATEEQHPPGMGLSQPFQHDVTCYKCGERG